MTESRLVDGREARGRAPRLPRRRFLDVSRLRTLLSIVIVCAFWELQGDVLHNQFLPPLSAILSTQFDLFSPGCFGHLYSRLSYSSS